MIWKRELAESVTTISELRKFLHLTSVESDILDELVERFPIRIPRYYLNLIDKSDPNDPIRKIIVPSTKALKSDGYFDTSGEHDNTVIQGLQHKYSATALLLVTNACAGYCQHCFRKRLVDQTNKNDEILRDYDKAFEYIRSRPEISNVLVSGGDPLMLDNEKLDYILSALCKIKHIKFIRIGTKIPAFLPSRITTDRDFQDILSKHTTADKRIYIMTHFDHPKEITAQTLEGLDLLVETGVILANQAVLLRGVNDNPSTIAELFETLCSYGVSPYYLFQCRPVKGSLHAQVPIDEGYFIFEKAKAQMSGLAKRARLIMSHYTGKIEILGVENSNGVRNTLLKYHQAREAKNLGRVFSKGLSANGCWLD